jgi:3-oxoacyl-[acyl-carrier-protein] synthase II
MRVRRQQHIFAFFKNKFRGGFAVKKMLIKSASAISIQKPLTNSGIWNPETFNMPQVRCQEPAFSDFMRPMTYRRMSPIIKRAIVTSVNCVRESAIEMPDAIISGTGLGCVEDTEKFLNAMVTNGEHFLQPTYFIQSTHNTISSQVAIHLQCHGFNNTHVHRGISFESALHEMWVLSQLDEIHTAIVGGYDEMTPTYFKILGRLGYWRNSVEDTLSITRSRGKGSFSGEGSVSFMLSDTLSNGNGVAVENVEIGYEPYDFKTIVGNFLEKSGLQMSDVDAVMTGRNGDCENDDFYDEIMKQIGVKEAFYKNLCGEYFTAPAYGMFTAYNCILAGKIPAHLTVEDKDTEGVHRILLLHHWQKKNYSLILLSICGG